MIKARQLITRSFACQIYGSAQEAVDDIPNFSRIAIGGYIDNGVPFSLVDSLCQLGAFGLKVYNISLSSDGYGATKLIQNNQVRQIVCSSLGNSTIPQQEFAQGKLEVRLIPQGTFAERLRAAGAGIPAFYTTTGVDSIVETGYFPQKYMQFGKRVQKYSEGRPRRNFEGVDYLLEQAIYSEWSLIKAYKADTEGNLIYKRTSRNINPEIAMCSPRTIAEVEEIVEAGQLDPDEIVTPGIFVKRLVQVDKQEGPANIDPYHIDPNQPFYQEKSVIAKRAALEINDGMYVHLDIGIPQMIHTHIPSYKDIYLHSNVGSLGIKDVGYAQPSADMKNCQGHTINFRNGASVFSTVDSIEMIRGGHLDLIVLGAYQVSENGDLANWLISPKLKNQGFGAAMDSVSNKNNNIIVTMLHNYEQDPKIVKNCSLPITGKGVVSKIITEKGVFEVVPGEGLTMTEIAKGEELEQIKELTACEFKVSSNLSEMKQS